MKIISLFDLMLRSLALSAFWTLFCLAAIPAGILRYACYTLTRGFRVDPRATREYRVIPTPERSADLRLFRAG